MGADDFAIEGLDALEERFLRHAEKAHYLVLKDRTQRNTEDSLGRMDLDEGSLSAWIEDDDEPEDDVDDGLPSVAAPKRRASKDDLLRAAFGWVRETAIRNAVGDACARFRLKLFGPKGIQCLDCGQFVVRHVARDDDDIEAEAQVKALKIPTPSFDGAANDGAVKGLRALGDYYAQWGQIVLGSVGQLQGVNNAMVARLHRQLQETRDQVDKLVASILEFRVAEVEAKERVPARAETVDARTELARDALRQLGAAANTVLVGKGLTPEGIEVITMLGGSPELMAALQDPGVKELMKEKDNLKGIAGMLRQAGAAAMAARQAAAAVETINSATAEGEPVAQAS